jgi:hypothetical protein
MEATGIQYKYDAEMAQAEAVFFISFHATYVIIL